jgi:hypothetical protein
MKKYKRPKLKKYLQQKRQRIATTNNLIKQYSLKQWLETIRQLNISHPKYDDINDQLKTKPEFLVVASDMALRISKNNENNINLGIPQVNYLLQSEIELADNPKSFIKLFGIGGISFLATWQNKFHYSRVNMLGRMTLLYELYNDYFLENIGLTIKDLYIILLAILTVYENKEKIYFTRESIISNEVESLSKEKINSFLNYFSITQKEYIQKAKRDKIYEKSFGEFKYLIRYPIIQINDSLYITPVFEQLIDSISNNLYFLLLESHAGIDRKTSAKFLTEFGYVLEKYVLNLARYQFGIKKVVDANRIVKNNDDFRCEAVVINKRKALAIEVKKMYFKRDAIVDMDKIHIDALLEKHIVKAYQQIESTLTHIKYKEQYGLIVIPDIMLGLSAIKSYIEKQFFKKAKFNDNIFICTLSSYESLMANSQDDVFLILEHVKKKKISEGNDINMVMYNMINNGINIKVENNFLQKNNNDILVSLRI